MTQDLLFQRYGRSFPAGTVLFRQGDPGGEMYVIVAGKVEIICEVRGHETVLAILPAGEFLGELSIINNRPRSATARVVEDARVLVLDRGTFEAMVRSNTEIAIRLIRKLAARLDEAGRQIEVLLLRDPSSRVAHYLRQLAERRGQPDAAGVAVHVGEEELAEKLGLSIDEVQSVIEKLEQSRLISRAADGAFIVAEAGKLQDFLDFIEMQERYGAE